MFDFIVSYSYQIIYALERNVTRRHNNLAAPSSQLGTNAAFGLRSQPVDTGRSKDRNWVDKALCNYL